MDRRIFFKTLISAPLLTPLLLAAKEPRKSLDLYLISEDPQDIIYPILSELHSLGLVSGNRYSFLSSHPKAETLSQLLEKKGWRPSVDAASADLLLSFGSLDKKARSSFTLIRDGSVFDLRTRSLLSLWKEIHGSSALSTTLTTASLRYPGQRKTAGRSAEIRISGIQKAVMPLNRSARKVFSSAGGPVVVRTEAGKAWIEDSSCRHKICRLTAPVCLSGERIICAPRRFVLEITGAGGVDTVIG